jgi:hypothetical protein
MTIQTITMLTWAYATAAPYNKDLFEACCEVALNDWQSIDVRVPSTSPCLHVPCSRYVDPCSADWICTCGNQQIEPLFHVASAWSRKLRLCVQG